MTLNLVANGLDPCSLKQPLDLQRGEIGNSLRGDQLPIPSTTLVKCDTDEFCFPSVHELFHGFPGGVEGARELDVNGRL